ncbi:MAG: beta-lactamase family protein, partial [Luteimonas sp.]|nr:beta-lactamase family protein [Luteimonas sp.]
MIHQVRVLSAVLLVLSSSACTRLHTTSGAGDRAPEARRSVLDREVPALLTEQIIPSVSIAQIEDGRIVMAAAYGEQSPGVPVSTTSLYNIASMAKPISAEVVLRLASQGRLSLDEPMYRYWTDPDIAHDERHKLLTPRLALSHQTGFANWRRETGGVLTFKHAPGAAYGYSGEGIEYVARFTEKKTGAGFETLAQTLVFDPIGMRQTAYTRRPWFEGRIAVPTDVAGKSLEPMIAGHYIASDLVYSTATDYATFMLSLMHDTALSDDVARARRTIQVPSGKAKVCAAAQTRAYCPKGFGFGLGWEVIQFEDATYLMHTGV